MKTCFFVIIITIFTLASCTPPKEQTPTGPKDELGYYIYNPEDTIDNQPFCDLLWIDSARVEYRHDNPISQWSTSDIGGFMRETKTLDERRHDDSLVFAEAETAWYKMMALVSKKQYEEALENYIHKDAEIGIALSTSTLKFDLDYFVVGKLLFMVLDEDEAVEQLVKIFEYDKFQTESVLAFSMAEGGSGYVPPHYAFLLERLCYLYMRQEEWEKVEELLEPHRKAVYLLSDDVLVNEQHILSLKLDILTAQEDRDGVKQAFIEYRDFMIHYVNETGEDLPEEIEKINEIIEYLEEYQEPIKVGANA